LRSGFRLRAPASLTPANRLNLGCEGSAVQICPSRPFNFRSLAKYARDFACGLPLRSRPQTGSTWGARGRQFKSARPDHSTSGPLAKYAREGLLIPSDYNSHLDKPRARMGISNNEWNLEATHSTDSRLAVSPADFYRLSFSRPS